MPPRTTSSALVIASEVRAPAALSACWRSSRRGTRRSLWLDEPALGSNRRLRAWLAKSYFDVDRVDWGVLVTIGPNAIPSRDFQGGISRTIEEALDAVESNAWTRLTSHERASITRYLERP